MKKVFFTLFMVMSFCYFSYSQELTTIESELQEEMNVRAQDEMISINIIMKSQYNQMEMRRKSSAYKTKENKRSFVINELKRFSKESQIGILNELQAFERGLKVQNIKSHWIFNGINCLATPEAIEAIASNPDVLIIGYNREQNLLPEGETPSKADATRELTYNVLKVNADDVWGLGYTGEDVIIAVIDTGVNYNHVDLADHLWNDPNFPNHGYDFFGNDDDPMDDMGHGTHCAGTVCGDGTAGSKTGMAPDATLMAIKVLNQDGNGSINNICDGVAFAVEHGAHVFSMSLGFPSGGTNSERIQFRNTMINSLEAGVVGAVAAGNEGDQTYQYPIPNNVRVPGNCPPPWLHPDQTITGGLTCVVCVGSTDQNDNASYFTGKGPVTWQSIAGFNDYAYNPGIGLIRPDVCAPGSDIKSLNFAGNSGYTMMSGTSMATPCVAGVMGLLLSKNLELTPAQIDEILETTGVPLSETKSNIFGSGRIDAYAAVEEVVVGPVIFYSYELNEVSGNHDGKLNPGETVKLTISMKNISEEPVSDVAVAMTSDNEHVSIVTGLAMFGDFEAGEIKTMEDVFTFTLDDSAPAKQNVKLSFEASSEEETCVTRCNIMTFDYILNPGFIVVVDPEGNNDGALDPGETADLQIFVNNIGNDFASSLNGILATSFPNLTINSNNKSLGSLLEDQSGYASYNVTLSENVAPEDVIIPLTLAVTDIYGRETELSYTYQNKCNVVFDLHDSYGDGWNGAMLRISFNDGTPTQEITINNGTSATFTFEIISRTIVSLNWTSGNWDEECSFSVAYEGGDVIYDGSTAPQPGDFYTWTNSCSGGGGIVTSCEHVDNLEVENELNDVVLNWDATETAVSYNVYRNFEMIANNIIGTTYTDTDLESANYCYMVTAVCEDGTETNASNQVCIDLTTCEAPVLLATAMENEGEPAILLSWLPMNNAQQYTIYQGETIVKNTIDTSALITEIEWNEEYCFTATSTCPSGESEHSAEVCKKVDFCFAPENLAALQVESSIELTWNASENAQSYSVYRNANMIAESISDYNYTDADIQIGQYSYTVTANCEVGESGFSNEAVIDITGIEELDQLFKILPNPANQELTVEGLNMESIVIYNVLGQMVENIRLGNQNKVMINTTALDSGLYIFRIATREGNIVSKHVSIAH